MNVLITGANGFLGSMITRQAVNAGLSVTATDRTINTKNFYDDFVPADILDPLCPAIGLDGIDCVCHVAGLAHVFNKSEAYEYHFNAVNVTGTENVANASIRAGVKHFIFISSVSVYGGISNGKDEESECHPEGPYAESKLKAEQHLVELCRKTRMSLTILRLTTLYGEGDPGNLARLIRSIDQKHFIWVGKGENLKSLLHVEDAARACIEVIKTPASGINIYNVSSPQCKMHDIVDAIGLALNKPIPSWHVPASFALNSAKIIKILSFNSGRFRTFYDTLQKWLTNDYYNTDKFCNTFNFKTKVNLKEGIKREAEGIRKSV